MATHYFASHQGGIEIVAGRLFNEVAALGGKITWIASNTHTLPEIDENQRVVDLPTCNWIEEKVGVPFPVVMPSAVRTIVREVRRADIVLIHDCLYLSNIVTFICARFYRKPVVLVQHTGVIGYSSAVLRNLARAATAIITRRMLERADQVVFISETSRKHFDGVPYVRRPETIFNGIDAETFRPCSSNESKAALRNKFGLPADIPVVLFVGRFVENKGLPVLKEMVQRDLGCTWVFAGRGPLDPTTWAAANVRVFSNLQGASLAELYRASDVFVLPSKAEGFPLVIQEAIASGLPVVCGSDTVTADEELSSFVDGVKSHPGELSRTAAAFLGVINRVIAAGPTSKEESDRRHTFARFRYSWSLAANRYLKIASALCGLSAVHSRSLSKGRTVDPVMSSFDAY